MVTPLPDLVGNNSIQQFTTQNLSAAWVQIIVTGSGTVRLGNNVTQPTAVLGLPIPAGGGFFFPWRLQGIHPAYNLSQGYAYIPTGAKVSIGYVPY